MSVEAARRIAEHVLMPAVRTATPEAALLAAQTLIAAGISVLELPFTVPDAPSVIAELRRRFPEALVGAGTILSVDAAETALAAGAQFLVSPNIDAEVIAVASASDVPSIPGALTPTEIVLAAKCGADFIKVFPASSMGGPSYIRSLLAPLPALRLMPMGGVSTETAEAYLSAGAVALGVGADLVPAGITADQLDRVAQKAEQYLNLIRSVKKDKA